MQYPRIMQPTHARWEPCNSDNGSPPEEATSQSTRADSMFSQIPSILKRNFMISDTYYVSPPATGFGIPGPDGDVLDVGPLGLAATSGSVAATMPSECLRALESVRGEAVKWKNSWRGEKEDGERARLRISYNQ